MTSIIVTFHKCFETWDYGLLILLHSNMTMLPPFLVYAWFQNKNDRWIKSFQDKMWSLFITFSSMLNCKSSITVILHLQQNIKSNRSCSYSERVRVNFKFAGCPLSIWIFMDFPGSHNSKQRKFFCFRAYQLMDYCLVKICIWSMQHAW